MSEDKKVAYVTKVNVPDSVIKSYAISDATVDQDKENNKRNKSNAQILSDEFITNFRNARTARVPYEEKWDEMNLYVWGRAKEKVTTKNGKQKPTETSQNLLWGIFQRKLAEMCADNLVNFDITPARIPEGAISKELQNVRKETEAIAQMANEDPATIEQELRKMIYTQYVGRVNEFNSLLKQLFKRAMTQDMLKRVYTDGLITGTSVVEMTYSSSDADEIVSAVHVPVYDCFIEPGTINFQESRYFIVSQKTNLLTLMTNPATKENMTPEVVKQLQKNYASSKSWKSDNINRENDTTGFTGAEQIPYHRYYKRYLDSKGNVQIACYHFVGSGEAPFLVAGEDKIGISSYPFAILFFNKRTDQLYGKSFLDFLLPTQKLINKYEAIVKLRLLQSARPNIFLARNSGVDPTSFSSTTLTPGTVHVTNVDNPQQAVSVVQLDQVPGDFVNFLDRAQNNLNTIANVNDAYTGNNKITGTGSQAASQQLNRALLPEKLNSLDIQTFIKGALSLIIEWTTQHDDQLRTIVYTEPTDPTGMNIIAFNGTDYKDLQYNLNVNVHIKTATEKQAEAQAMMQLYQLKLQFPGLSPVITEEELIDALDLTNKENALTRLQMQREVNVEQGAQQILQLIGMMEQQQMQITQTQAQVQTAVQNGEMDSKQAQQVLAQTGQPLQQEDFVNIVADIMRKATGFDATQQTSPQNAGGITQQGGQ